MRSVPSRYKYLLLIPGAMLPIVLAIYFLAVPALWNRHVESCIARFQSEPSQAGADTLVNLLDRQAVTSEQGKRILDLLFRPKLITRKAYPLGERPSISIELPFNLHFTNMIAGYERHVWANNEHQYGTSGKGPNSFKTRPQLLGMHPTPENSGTYHFEIRYMYALIPTTSKTTWSWTGPRRRFPLNLLPVARHTTVFVAPSAEPVYQCRFTVPVDILVVEKQEAEQVTCVSNPQLDWAMFAAFRSIPRPAS